MKSWLVYVVAGALAVPAFGMGARDDMARGELAQRAVSSSRSYLRAHALELKAADNTALDVRSIVFDQLGEVHVRFNQSYRGLPVFEGQLITHVGDEGQRVAGITDALRPVRGLDVRPTIAEADAVAVGLAQAGVPGGADSHSKLMVFVERGSDTAHLAWRVHTLVDDGVAEPVDWITFVDAHSGAVLLSYDNLHTGKGNGHGKPGSGGGGGTATATIGTGYSLYLGTVSFSTENVSGTYDMTDLTRGGAQTTDMKGRQNGSGTLFTDSDNIWGDGTNNDSATAGVDASFGAAMTFDFYQNTFGRNGIYDDGKGALSRVHYGRRYNNAFWSDSCRCMTYGDGDGNVLSPLVSLDVAGHEMTHGVTAATANLTYSGESGGLNESISDIFGTAVEFFAAQFSSKKPNYWIGEDVYTPKKSGDALRYMDDPTKDGYSIDNYSQYYSGLDVHYSSGLANNVFYLLANGGTNRTSGMSVSPIGLDEAEHVFYRALTVYMTSGTNFAGARSATMQAASDLYGAAAASTVGSAWSACGVN